VKLTLEIPDDVAEQLRLEGVDVSREVLEGFALKEYRAGTLSRPQVRKLLGFESRFELDDFLKLHNVTEDLMTVEEFEDQLEGLRRLGFRC
jgi:hypothetical protein